VQQPNFYGNFEDCTALGEIAHAGGAKYIMGCNPMALAVSKTPAACGADIAVGEGQPLGMPLSFGGPYLGFMAATNAMTRKLPGRIVGETVDADGNRAYVLTLQAREQHIRREKASSNVCSNQALCALTAAVYMSTMGPEGIKQAAMQSMSKAHYFANALSEIPGVSVQNSGVWFHEFVTALPVEADAVLDALAAQDILGGLPVEGGILWCVTELVSKEQLDHAVAIIKEVCAK
jgi:glycine dehydrogenase subunit 1